jgi:hypothetical protein
LRFRMAGVICLGCIDIKGEGRHMSERCVHVEVLLLFEDHA